MKKILFIPAIIISSVMTGQNTLKLTAGATLKTTGGAIITVEGLHLDNDGTINLAAGDGTFRFSGSSNTNISGTSIPVFDRLEMAKINTQLLLMGDINVTSRIDFTSGLLNLNNHKIILQPAAFLNGESESSRIIGSAGGYIEITTTLNTPSSVNAGNLGAVITSSQNLGSTTIRRGHVSQAGNPGMGSSIQRYYDILPSNNSSLNATLRFQYFDAELNGFDENAMLMWKSPDNINWSNQGFTSRDATLNYVEKTGITDFSRWTLAPGNSFMRSDLISSALRNENDDSKYAGNNIKDQWTIWPNPMTNVLWINITTSGQSKASIKVFDSKGSLITTQQEYLRPGKNLVNINLKQLTPGIYSIVTEWNDGKVRGYAGFIKQ
jgi:hypothetical protein